MAVKAKEVEAFVTHKLYQLLASSNDGPVKGRLANMRRGVGHKPGEIPELWGMLFQDMPEAMLSRGSEPSRAEWATYTALTLFAVHQQGHDLKLEPMLKQGQSLGTAVRALVPAGDEDALKRVQDRFNMVATSTDMGELANHLRGVVQLLRQAKIPLDYSLLAVDLYRYQFPEAEAAVRLHWGQDFYRIYQNENDQKEIKQ